MDEAERDRHCEWIREVRRANERAIEETREREAAKARQWAALDPLERALRHVVEPPPEPSPPAEKPRPFLIAAHHDTSGEADYALLRMVRNAVERGVAAEHEEMIQIVAHALAEALAEERTTIRQVVGEALGTMIRQERQQRQAEIDRLSVALADARREIRELHLRIATDGAPVIDAVAQARRVN